MTTPGAVKLSIDHLVVTRLGVLVARQSTVAPLLELPQARANFIGAFAEGAGDGARAGIIGQGVINAGFSVRGGFAFGSGQVLSADARRSVMVAGAVRYQPPGDGLRPFLEAGGWFTRDARLILDRPYANGAGTAVGTGATTATATYGYARGGVAWAAPAGWSVRLSMEGGEARQSTDAYAEPLSNANPFEALVPEGRERLTLGKVRLEAEGPLSPRMDFGVSLAGAGAFSRSSDLHAVVDGFGDVVAAPMARPTWVEFGARLGYRLTPRVVVDAFANGVGGVRAVPSTIGGGFAVRMIF